MRHIPVEPFRRDKGVRFLHGRKFHFGDDEWGKRFCENVQLYRIGRARDKIPFFGDAGSVRFREQVLIGSPVEREIIFLPRHQTFAFVGQVKGIVFPADAYDGGGIQICLFDNAEWIGIQVGRQRFDGKFAFDFHKISDPFC